MPNIIGLVNFHNSPDLAPITESRPLGSTSFLGRYAFCDFSLSCLCNSGIDTVGLLVKDHQRSILKHLGSMDAWQRNTKLSKTVVMYNEMAHLKPSMNTDVQNIKENDWVLYDSNASNVVILSSHILASFDLREAIAEHIARDEMVTAIATPVENLQENYLGQAILDIDNEGYVRKSTINHGKRKGPAICSMSAIIIKRTALAAICQTELELEPKKPLRDLLLTFVKRRGGRIHTWIYNGFSICIDSFKKYVDSSFLLLDPDMSSLFFRPDYNVYTLTHDTPPAIYGSEAEVSEAYIANGSQIEGSVIHSIIARDVKVGKGAVVRNSIIFSSVKIDDGAVVENCVIDKFAIVTKRQKVIGKPDDFIYIRQGAII